MNDRERVRRACAIRELPRSQNDIRDILREAGFNFQPGDSIPLDVPVEVPHDAQREDLEHIDGLSCLLDCADAVLRTWPCEVNTDVPLTRVGSALAGPLTTKLVEIAKSVAFEVELASGYRSPFFQALLFAAAYLSGTLFDSTGRYRVLPPGLSDHNFPDVGIDVRNHSSFSFLLLLKFEELDCGLHRPYLAHNTVSFEPWHWRLEPVHKLRRYTDVRDWYEAQILSALSNSHAKDCTLRSGTHAFAMGFNTSGESICVGSNQHNLGDSVTDALDAVGAWPSYYFTIPLGFTPSFDGNIQEYDVGSCVFKAEGNKTGSIAYLTAQACINSRLLDKASIVDALDRKGEFSSREEEFYLSKSRMLEYIASEDAIFPAEFGTPNEAFAARRAASSLLEGYCDWLVSSQIEGIPPYHSADYGRSFSEEFHPTRYALLFKFLCEITQHGLSDTKLVQLQNRLENRLIEVPNLSGSAKVFLLQGYIISGKDHSVITYGTWRSCISQHVQTTLSDRDWIGFGHACDLLAKMEILSLGNSRIQIDPDILVSAFKSSLEDSVNIVASSSILRLISADADAERHVFADEAARDLIRRLMNTRRSPLTAEHGAFGGFENFQSALFIEAIANLLAVCRLSKDEETEVKIRVQDALAYLRRLQFSSLTSVLTGNPERLSGSVRYSLIDHHFRFDYGLHAARAALLFIE